MSKYVSKCPCCGEEALEVECQTVVLYSISDDGEGGQDWRQEEVFDDSAEPFLVKCAACGDEWLYGEFDANSSGITRLESRSEQP